MTTSSSLIALFNSILILFLYNNKLANSFSLNKQNNNFFTKECNVTDNDLTIIKSIDQKNYKLIDTLQNEHIKSGLLLYLISGKKTNFNKSDYSYIISKVGIKSLLQIPQLRTQMIDFYGNDNQNINQIIEMIGYNNLFYNDKITILYLLNKINNGNDELSTIIINDLMRNYALKDYDFHFILNIYKRYISDDMILSQVRQQLYDHNLYFAQNIEKFIKNNDIYNHTQFLIQFYQIIYYEQIKYISNKNYNNKKDKKHKNIKHNDKNLNYLIDKFGGKDEYVDLILAQKIKDLTKKYEIITKIPGKSFKQHEWMDLQIKLAKEIMTLDIDKKYDYAYNLVANVNNFNLKAKDYLTQQWLAGFIAYNMQDYKKAIYHFHEHLINVKFAGSKSRGYYWLGLALKKDGQIAEANYVFQDGLNFPFTFYGQTSMDEVNIPPQELIQKKIEILDKMSSIEDDNLCKDRLFVAGYIAYLQGQRDISDNYFRLFFENQTDELTKIKGLIVLENETEHYFHHAIAKHSAQYNVISKKSNFPKLKEVSNHLTNAIIKQESAFKQNATSYKGARGLMQIMPQTAKLVASQSGLKYNIHKLLTDTNYNLTLGQTYLHQLLKQYNNHKVLALAAYNAGPGSVNRWIKRNGDPRNMTTVDDIVLWIEKIPFAETREYVMKILESEIVYEVLNNS